MDVQLGLAALIGLGAAFVLMYVVLRKYTYPAVEQPFFSDPTFFFIFTIGLAEGTIILLVFTYTMVDAIIAKTVMSMAIAIIFGAIAELVKLVTLNLKRFAGKSDTIFYGFGLGLGSGAAMATGLVYFFGIGGQWGTDAGSWVVIFIFMFQYLLLNTATGLIIGEGVARYSAFEYFLKALLYEAIFQILFVGAFMVPSDMFWLVIIILVADLAFVCYLLYQGAFKRLPYIVEEVKRQEKQIMDAQRNVSGKS